jgi:hypothetical protein
MIINPRIGMQVIVKYDVHGTPLPEGSGSPWWYRNKNVRGVISAFDLGDRDPVKVDYIGSPEARNVTTSLIRLEEYLEPQYRNLCRGGQDL